MSMRSNTPVLVVTVKQLSRESPVRRGYDAVGYTEPCDPRVLKLVI